ncbi:phage tail assembly chaperone [Bacillus horti]|uniref:Phage portal protein n=1 Tax=Caldalkalibacillus horti TaxID=77523 RepID=A0ABT9W0Q8_9BACI|nr:phage portal protein [Bacillus horti]MDQ0166637.1 hypothetical protein [Bacillus horti]
MSELQAFFAQNVKADVTENFIVSERFKGQDGKPIPWKLRTMTEAENEEIRKSATTRVKQKRGTYAAETNHNEYMVKLVVASVVHPDLKNAELQKSYGVMGADMLLKEMLFPGEYGKLAGKVVEMNGFDEDINDLMDEAKN